MANRKVVLVRYCKTEKGWRRFPVAMGKNGRIRPNFVLVKGKPVEYPDGHYELRTYQGSKAMYRNVGTHAGDAINERDREALRLTARGAAAESGAVLVEDQDRVPLQKMATKFVTAAEDRGASVAAEVYRLAVTEFLSTTNVTFADQVRADTITAHHNVLKKRGASDRTVHNRHASVKAFLVYCGVESKTVGRPPRFEKTLPEIYETGLNDFFNFLKSEGKEYEYLVFNLLLKLGLREQEAMYLEWDDISFTSKTLTIHSKPKLGFKIKDKEERALPVTTDLLALLLTRRAAHLDTRFVIGNAQDRPNTHLLRTLKRLVRSAGMNCGKCDSCEKNGECERWFLHKFRATYCTQLLRSGLDLSTVQKMMGHSDIASTMRYLRPQDDAHTQARINSIQWS